MEVINTVGILIQLFAKNENQPTSILLGHLVSQISFPNCKNQSQESLHAF
jgi:hypothetical protein